MSVRDVLIVGAGPSGLSAAIAAKQRGLEYQVLEQGVLVNSIYDFPPQMVFFTTPELLEIGGLPFVSPFEKPTRNEALKYYRKVVDAFDLQIAYEETVLSVEREHLEGERTGETSEPETAGGHLDRVFAVETRSARGVKRVRHARNVVFAVGYYDHPVLLGIPGEELPHVHHYYGEPHPYYRKRVVIVGGGNSAAEAALEMHRAGAHVTLVHRRSELKRTIKYWVRPDIENRIKEGSIVAKFGSCVKAIRPTSVVIGPGVDVSADTDAGIPAPADSFAAVAAGDTRSDVDPVRLQQREEEIPADAVFLLTGYRADSALMTCAGITLTDRDAPTIDPATFETNVPGLFVAGGAIAGQDTGTIFIENGRFHGEKIIETIAARRT
ncbi:MAG TPA: NAD(P)-binding domain-containing protein [Vicinamibacterales bacterium]|jgi:thioredoxin reductase (NADPH)|nr:NAD(P)-binding domain-containing protein [Vicinamibacterales bacterium]